MTESFMSSLTQIAKASNNDGSNNLNICNIYLQVTDISNNSAGVAYARGTNLITDEIILVRLSTIDESANDLVKMKKANTINDAKHTITKLYAGQKPREGLIAKRDKRRANFLFFDRCFFIGIENGLPTYRSHWANAISQQTNIETVTGYVNIQYRDETANENGRIRAWANVLEFCRFFSIHEKEKNLEMIHYALRPTVSKKNESMREGRFQAEITNSQNNVIAAFNIPQKYVETQGVNSNGLPSIFLAPCSSTESITAFLTKDGNSVSNFAVSKDVARIVLNAFCDLPYNSSEFVSSDSAYLQNLEILRQQLLSGELNVKVFGSRTYRFGRETLQELTPQGKYNPLRIFTRELSDEAGNPTGQNENLYVPMLLIMQIADTGRRYIVFNNRLHYNTLGEGKPKSLRELTDDLDRTLPHKTKMFTVQ